MACYETSHIPLLITLILFSWTLLFTLSVTSVLNIIPWFIVTVGFPKNTLLSVVVQTGGDIYVHSANFSTFFSSPRVRRLSWALFL